MSADSVRTSSRQTLIAAAAIETIRHHGAETFPDECCGALIAVDGRTVVFVEVKTRSAHDAGHPAEAVDYDKQRRLTRAASAYRKRHDLLETAARFDVIAITWPAGKGQPVIEHFKNAFEATE